MEKFCKFAPNFVWRCIATKYLDFVVAGRYKLRISVDIGYGEAITY